MRIVVTGRNGQLARSLAERATSHELIFIARPEFNLEQPASIGPAVTRLQPEMIISAAAYTAVDQAEDEPEIAQLVNVKGPEELARVAAEIGVPIVHLSTDYVFDGSGDRPWRETDPVSPLSVYGSSKLAGERAVAESGALHMIVRTAWIYSPFGHNFVKTMLRLAETRDELKVVDDQVGCPTSALDIAEGLIAIADIWDRAPSSKLTGTFHLAGPSEMTWAGFAEAIFTESRRNGGPSAKVLRIPSKEYSTRAPRPANSRLDSTLFQSTFGYRSSNMEKSLSLTIKRILSEARA